MYKLTKPGFFKSAAFFSFLLLSALASQGCGTAEDTSTPDTILTTKPSNPSSSTVTFEFYSDQGDASFECRIDLSQWSPCASPATFSGIPSGARTFQVRAVGSNHVPDPTPETYTWTVN